MVTHATARQAATTASMRPGDFSPGNKQVDRQRAELRLQTGFNEAGGFLPRKPRAPRPSPCSAVFALQ